MKKSLYFLFILALFCLTGCKDALVPKPIKLTCNINTFDAPISCISRSTADADKLYIGQEDGCSHARGRGYYFFPYRERKYHQ